MSAANREVTPRERPRPAEQRPVGCPPHQLPGQGCPLRSPQKARWVPNNLRMGETPSCRSQGCGVDTVASPVAFVSGLCPLSCDSREELRADTVDIFLVN